MVRALLYYFAGTLSGAFLGDQNQFLGRQSVSKKVKGGEAGVQPIHAQAITLS